MKLIVCVDDQGGVMFNRRRVSSDRRVVADIMDVVGDSQLFISEYSAKLFSVAENISALKDFSAVGADDYVFLEDTLLPDSWAGISEVVVYHWNRLYPSDLRFPVDELRSLGKLMSVLDFKGNSHEKITREVYTL